MIGFEVDAKNSHSHFNMQVKVYLEGEGDFCIIHKFEIKYYLLYILPNPITFVRLSEEGFLRGVGGSYIINIFHYLL